MYTETTGSQINKKNTREHACTHTYTDAHENTIIPANLMKKIMKEKRGKKREERREEKRRGKTKEGNKKNDK